MISTHLFDLIAKVMGLITAVYITISIPILDSPVLRFIGVITFWFVLHYFIFRTLGSWLYCKFVLKMDVSFAQAKTLNKALSPLFNFHLKWLPLKEVRAIDKHQRYEVALKLTKDWQPSNKK